MFRKYNIKKYLLNEACILFALIFVFLNIGLSFAKETGTKYYVIKNPRTNVERIVGDDGNIIMKTNEPDDYETLFIIYEEVGGREFFVKRINAGNYEHTWELYNNRGEFIEKGEGWGPYIADGYLYPDADIYFENNLEYGEMTPSGRKIKLFNDADLNNKESRTVNQNKVEDPSKKAETKSLHIDREQVERGRQKEEEKKKEEEQKQKTNIAAETDYYKIINAGDHFEYYSKTSDFELKDILTFGIANKEEDLWLGRRIDYTYIVTQLTKTGKIKYITYNQNYGYEAFDEVLSQCDNKLILRERWRILDEGHITVVSEYGDTPYSYKELIKEKFKDVNINDMNEEVIFYAKEKPKILYTEGEIDYLFYIPNKTAYAIEVQKNKLQDVVKVNTINLDTFEVNNNFKSEGVFLFVKTKENNFLFSLLRNSLKLLYDNIKSDYFKELRSDADHVNGIKSLRNKFRNTCIVCIDDKYKVIDKNGNIIVDDLKTDICDEPIINKTINGGSDWMFNVTNKNGTFVFDEDGKLLFEGLKKDNVLRSGNYYLVYKDNAYNICYKDGTTLVKNVDYSKYNYDGRTMVNGTRIYNYEDLKWPAAKNGLYFFDDYAGHLIVYDKGKAKMYMNDGKTVDKSFKYVGPFYNEYESNIRNVGEGSWNKIKGHADDYFVYVEGFKFGLMDFDGVKKFEFSIFDDGNED